MVGFPNMGFFEPLRYITQFRTVWLAGWYGGGKTALAVELAAQLIEEKFVDKVVSNFLFNIGGCEIVIKKGEI
jgi:DNA helicase TIP49 (TBP-interacting protein)